MYYKKYFILQLIAAEGEKKSSFALRDAAEIIHSTPIALQLRYMQSVISTASEKESTILFPIPINLFNSFLSKDKQLL